MRASRPGRPHPLPGLWLAAAIVLGWHGAGGSPAQAGPLPDPATLPVRFLANQGQLDASIAFQASTPHGPVTVTRDARVLYALPGTSGGRALLVAEAAVSSRRPGPRGEGAVSRVSWLVGRDRSRWRTGVPAHEAVSFGQPWPGIEMRLAGRAGTVEKIFEVRPGASPRDIALRLSVGPGGPGDLALGITGEGALEVRGQDAVMTLGRPVAYQERDGRRVPVAVRYAVRRPRRADPAILAYGFEVGPYDRRLPLVIDPLLGSTFLGGRNLDRAYAVAVDRASGHVFVAGLSWSTNFPTTPGAYDRTHNPAPAGIGRPTADVVVSKLSGDLSQLLASTVLGGPDDDEATAIALGDDGGVYVAGWTNSTAFPVDDGQDHHGGTTDGFVARFSADLSRLDSARFLGGSSEDWPQALAVGPTVSGKALVYVTGWTRSPDFMPELIAQQRHVHGHVSQPADDLAPVHDNAFVSNLTWNAPWNLGRLSFREVALVGGVDHDRAYAVTVGWEDGNRGDRVVLVAGGTAASTPIEVTQEGQFPTTSGAYQRFQRAGAWVLVLSSELVELYASTILGGRLATAPQDFRFDTVARAVAVTGDREVYVAGYTSNHSFPTTPGAYATEHGSPGVVRRDGFVSQLDGGLEELLASTFLGGGQDDHVMGLILRPLPTLAGHDVFVTGYTRSADFPATRGTHDRTHNGGADGFVTRLDRDLETVQASTFLGGGQGDYALGLDRDANGHLFVAGYTSSGNFPTTKGAYDRKPNGSADAFVTKLSPALGR